MSKTGPKLKKIIKGSTDSQNFDLKLQYESTPSQIGQYLVTISHTCINQKGIFFPLDEANVFLSPKFYFMTKLLCM